MRPILITLFTLLPLTFASSLVVKDRGSARLDRRHHAGEAGLTARRGVSKCPSSFKPNMSGEDGWSFDINGHGPPAGCPSDWKYFGVSVGWQPTRSWQCGAHWSPPSFWESTCSRATWFTPPSNWQHPFSFPIPGFWKEHGFHSWNWPSESFACSNSGEDGWEWDWEGNTCIYGDIGWKWFGEGRGWLPPLGWKVPHPGWSFPPGFDSHKCPWWSPPVTTTKHIATTYHPHSTTTNKHTSKPKTTSHKTSYTHTKPKTTSHTTTHKHTTSVKTTSKPKTTTSKSHSTTSKPHTTTSKKVSTTIHHSSGPTHSPTPSNWQCNLSGEDGKPVDNYGHGCPYGEIGFLWFGTHYGWQPHAGWSCSKTWIPPPAWIDNCGLATWWVPPSGWIPPLSLTPPSFWLSHGWRDGRWPSENFRCSGDGEDGWHYDFEGHGCPSHLPSTWLWFGVEYGWQPPRSFVVLSLDWIPPSGWNCALAPWWQPNTLWRLPSGFGVPSWWPTIHLMGGWHWGGHGW